MQRERKKLGEILVEQNILTPLLVKRIIKIAGATHRRFGQTLEDLGLLTGEEIAQALSVQYGYKVVPSLSQFVIPKDVLDLVPVQTAFEKRIFPLQAKEGSLAIAMADPTNDSIVAQLTGELRLKIVPFISTTTEILKAIARCYLGKRLDPQPNTILIVETDHTERMMLATALTRERYTVLEAVDAADGFRQAMLHLPNVIVAAKEMPKVDGYAFFSYLQNIPETRRIPIILLARRASPEDEAVAVERGFFDYIPKPVGDVTLVTRVGRALAAGKSYVPHRRGSITLDLS